MSSHQAPSILYVARSVVVLKGQLRYVDDYNDDSVWDVDDVLMVAAMQRRYYAVLDRFNCLCSKLWI